MLAAANALVGWACAVSSQIVSGAGATCSLPILCPLLCQSSTIHVCLVQGLGRLPRIVRRLVLRQTPPIDRFVANVRPLFRLRPGWIRWRRSQQVEVWICTQTVAAVSRDWQRRVAVDGPLRSDAWSAREVGRVRRVPRFEALLARPVLRTQRCPGPSTTLQRSPTASTGAWERQRGLVRAFVIWSRVASSRHTTRGGPMLKQTCCVCWRSRVSAYRPLPFGSARSRRRRRRTRQRWVGRPRSRAPQATAASRGARPREAAEDGGAEACGERARRPARPR